MADVLVHGVIGSEVRSKRVVQELRDNPGATVRINSKGGQALEAIAIFNAVREANVDTLIEGHALSAGGIIALAGRKVKMMENSLLMLHNVALRMDSQMKATELTQAGEVVQKLEEQIVNTVAKKTNKDVAVIQALFDKETFLTAQEAFDMGFVDEVVPVKVGKFVDLRNLSDLPESIVAHAESFNKERKEMDLTNILSALSLSSEEGEEDTAVSDKIVNSIKELQTALEKARKPEKKDEEEEVKISSGMLNMAKSYRTTKINEILKEGKVTASVAKDLEAQYCDKDSLVASLTDDTDSKDEFEKIVNILSKNDPVVQLKGRTDTQYAPKAGGENRGLLTKRQEITNG